MRSLVWALIQCDWCPYRNWLGNCHTQREALVRTQWEDGHLQASEETNSPNTLILDFWPLKLWENTFLLLFKPSSLGHVVMAALVNKCSMCYNIVWDTFILKILLVIYLKLKFNLAIFYLTTLIQGLVERVSSEQHLHLLSIYLLSIRHIQISLEWGLWWECRIMNDSRPCFAYLSML